MSYFKSWKMMLWKGCAQYASKFGKLSSGHRTGKGQFSFQSQRKVMSTNGCESWTTKKDELQRINAFELWCWRRLLRVLRTARSNQPILKEISPEYSWLISFRIDWFDLDVLGALKSLVQHHSSKASILWCSAFFIVQLSHPYMTAGKTTALTRRTFVGKLCLCFLIHYLGWSQLFQGASVF